jgi:hypothetical protein
MSSILVQMATAGSRVFGYRRFGTGAPEDRALRAIGALAEERSDLERELALRHLRYEWDLMDEESATLGEVCRLQGRLWELRDRYPEARSLVNLYFDPQAPIARLFAAILLEGQDQGGREVRYLTNGPTPSTGSVQHLVSDEWRDALQVPRNLDAPFQGYLRRLDFIGYEAMRPSLYRSEDLPASLDIVWQEPGVVRLRFDKPIEVCQILSPP